MSYRLLINGAVHEVDGDAETPLLWVLRDDLTLRGTKYGCGVGMCGTCTVHADGQATRACQLQLAVCEGVAITTIEGLGKQDLGRRLQDAWVELDVPQCGYCQAGQLMAAAALLAEHPQPADADIRAAMVGNLCRCGTYPRIRQAIRQVAEGK